MQSFVLLYLVHETEADARKHSKRFVQNADLETIREKVFFFFSLQQLFFHDQEETVLITQELVTANNMFIK